MLGLILAAGDGTRMLPLTSTRPKSLLPIVNKPIIEHILDAFSKAGITEVTIVVGPDGKVKEHLGTKYSDLKLNYAIQEKNLGTADAVGKAERFLKQDFIVVNGDNLVNPGLLKELKEKHNGTATLALYETDEVSKLSSVEISGKKVLKITEKPKQPKSKLAGTGVYAFSPKVFEAIKKVGKSKRGEHELPDAIKLLIKEGEVSWIRAKEWAHVTHPWDLLKETKSLLNSMQGENQAEVEKNVTIKGKLIAGKGTLIRSGAYIEGPVLIGENCTIGPNCFLRSYSVIGNNCRVGQSVEVKNSIIMDNTYLPHQNYAGDSIIGSNCNIGAGTILANLRFDDGNVKFKVKEELMDTGLRKFGAVIGDNVKTGISSVVLPGRKIGAGARIWPGKVVDRNVEENSEYK